MSGANFDVAGVLVLHGGGLPDPRTAEPTCYCGWRGVAFSRSNTWLEQHAEHQADAISAYITETLGSSEAREAAARAIAELEPGEDWPTNEALGGSLTAGCCGRLAGRRGGTVSGVDVGGVMRAHHLHVMDARCHCGWRPTGFTVEDHRNHVAAAVSTQVSEMIADLRDEIAEASMIGLFSTPHGYRFQPHAAADRVVAVIQAALGASRAAQGDGGGEVGSW